MGWVLRGYGQASGILVGQSCVQATSAARPQVSSDNSAKGKYNIGGSVGEKLKESTCSTLLVLLVSRLGARTMFLILRA